MEDRNLNTPVREQSDFSLKNFLLNYLRYWYLFAISILLGFFIAKYYNWYATPVYAVTAKLLVKDDTGGQERLLKQIDVEGADKNIENEIEIFRSHNLLAKALDQLDFDVSYFLIGNVKVSEVYTDCPFRVTIDKLEFGAYYQPFFVDIIDSSNFIFHYEKGDETHQIEGVFGESFDMGMGYITLAHRANFPVRQIGNPDFEKRKYRISFNTINSNQNKYLSRLSVGLARPQSSILQIYLEDEVPQKGLDFVNALIDVYLKNDVEVKNNAASNTSAFLNSQLASITDDLERIETNRERYKVSKGIIDLESESQMVLEQLRDIDTQKAMNDARLSMIGQLKMYVIENQDLRDLAPASLDINDALLIKLINKLSELQSQREIIINQSTANDPTLVPINAEIELTRSSLLENIKNIEKSLENTANELSEKLRDNQNRVEQIPTTQRELLEIERKFRIQENLYIFLLQKHAELSISLAATESDTRLIDTARVLPGPISPVPQRAFSISLLLAIIIPVLIIIVLEKLKDKIESIAHIRKLTTVPLLGVVRYNKHSSQLVSVEKPRSSIAEEYRSIRTNLQFFNKGESATVTMVTSSIGTEGKTFTAMNLAAVMAASGERVVLVGLDMRKPRIVEQFEIANDIGSSNYLSRNTEIDDIIHPSGYLDTLFVIPSGPNPPNPSELIMSERMGELIEDLKKRFDKIVIDTPPIGLVSDGLILAQYADSTLYVVRDGVTHKDHLHHINGLYETGQLKNVAIIFNAVRQSRAGYGGHTGYGYGYIYGSEYGNYFDDEERTGGRLKKWFKRFDK